MKCGRGESLWLRPPRDAPDLTACEAERLTTRDMLQPNLEWGLWLPNASMPQEMTPRETKLAAALAANVALRGGKAFYWIKSFLSGLV